MIELGILINLLQINQCIFRICQSCSLWLVQSGSGVELAVFLNLIQDLILGANQPTRQIPQNSPYIIRSKNNT